MGNVVFDFDDHMEVYNIYQNAEKTITAK